MKKGDVDAAIDRFSGRYDGEARVRHPVSLPWRSSGKKGLEETSHQVLQRYLDLYPHAEDGTKSEKKSISFTRS